MVGCVARCKKIYDGVFIAGCKARIHTFSIGLPYEVVVVNEGFGMKHSVYIGGFGVDLGGVFQVLCGARATEKYCVV